MLESKQIKQIAILAKLSVQNQEKVLSAKLNSILDIIDDLSNISTIDVKPMFNPHDGVQRLRIDEVTENDNKDLYQKNNDKCEDGYYLVPKVL